MTTTPGMTSRERELRTRDCPGGIATGDVIAKVKAAQGDRPYMFGAVVHKTLNYRDSEGNDGYGYGAMEVIQATQGISTEINDGDYTEGLTEMGRLATIKLNLVLDFTLGHTNVDVSTLKAYVDGVGVGMMYDPSGNDVHLVSGGTALSVVDINYCLNQPTPPVPTPSPSPSPSSTPSGTDPNGGGTGGGGTNPNPNPSSTPSPSPTPSPVPTPTFIPPS
jgi:hypothetical protein